MGYYGDPIGGVHSDGDVLSARHSSRIHGSGEERGRGMGRAHRLPPGAHVPKKNGVLGVLLEAIDRVKQHIETENVTKAVLVASISFGGYSALVNSEFDDMVQYVPVIFAAGNYGDEAARRSPASSLQGLLGGSTLLLSRNGREPASRVLLQLWKVRAAVRRGQLRDGGGKPPNEYATTQGTSFAAPIVAGIALALKGESPPPPRGRSTTISSGWLPRSTWTSGGTIRSPCCNASRASTTRRSTTTWGEYRPLTPFNKAIPETHPNPPPTR